MDTRLRALERMKVTDPEKYRIETIRNGRDPITDPVAGDMIEITSPLTGVTWVRKVKRVTLSYVRWYVSWSTDPSYVGIEHGAPRRSWGVLGDAYIRRVIV